MSHSSRRLHKQNPSIPLRAVYQLMGSISSRNNNMGNVCTSATKDALPRSSRPTYEPSFRKETSVTETASTVVVDHEDVRLRAESENSSVNSPQNSFSYKHLNANCVKNGNVVSITLLPHQHSLFCERKVRSQFCGITFLML